MNDSIIEEMEATYNSRMEKYKSCRFINGLPVFESIEESWEYFIDVWAYLYLIVAVKEFHRNNPKWSAETINNEILAIVEYDKEAKKFYASKSDSEKGNDSLLFKHEERSMVRYVKLINGKIEFGLEEIKDEFGARDAHIYAKYVLFKNWLEEFMHEEIDPKLSLKEVALKYFYEGTPINESNCEYIANIYGHSSGHKLRQEYNYFTQPTNRTGDPGSEVKLKNAIKRLTKVIAFLKDEHKERAKSDLKCLELQQRL